MKKLFLCCTKPKCVQFQGTVELMKLWGLSHQPQAYGDRWFFDVTVPAYWGARRRDRFAEAINGWPTTHKGKRR